jgi:WD40 repeat protein
VENRTIRWAARRTCRSAFWPGLLAACIATASPLTADETAGAPATRPTPIQIAPLGRSAPVSFTDEILPILRQNCLACHNTADAQGELVLETPATIRKGGSSGAAVVPGQSAASPLLRRAAHDHETVMPPPDNKVGAVALSSEQLGLIKLWIDQGAGGEAEAVARVTARRPLPPNARPILAAAISPDDELVACNRGDQLFVYDLRGMKLAAVLVDPALETADRPSAANGGNASGGAAHEDLVRSLAFDPSSGLLASGGFRSIKLWRRPLMRLEREITAADAIRARAISPDGGRLALGTQAGRIELHDLDGRQPTTTLAGHEGAVTGLVFAPDGARLYSAGLDKSIRAWDAATGAGLGKLTTGAEVRSLALVDAGKLLATAEADHTLRLWQIDALLDSALAAIAAPATPSRELKGHAQPITALASIGTAGQRLLSGSEDGRLRFWDVATGQTLRELDHGSPVTGIAVRPDGQRFASIGANGVARLWNPDDGSLIAEIKLDPRAVRAASRADAAANYARACVEYRKEDQRETDEQLKREAVALETAQKNKIDAEKVVVDKTEPAAKAVEARTAADKALAEATAAGKVAGEQKAAAQLAFEAAEVAVNQAVKALELARDAAAKEKENAALAAARDEAEKLLAAIRSRQQAAEAARNQAGEGLRQAEQKIQPAKNAASDTAGKATTAERELHDARGVLEGTISFITTATIVQERAKAAVPIAQQAVGAAEALLARREAEKKQLADAGLAPQKPLRAAAFSADGKLLALAADASDVLLLDGNADKLIAASPTQVLADSGPAQMLAFAAAGRLVTTDSERRACVWRTGDPWTLERTIGRGDDPGTLVDRVLCVDFSRDGRLLATGGGLAARAGELKLWSVADGRLVREFPGVHRDTIYGVRFSPDGQWLATASADRTVKVFSVADGALVRTLAGHTHHVLGVCWHPQGKLLATCGADRTIKVWDFDAGTALRTLRGESYPLGDFKREVTSVAFVGETEHLLAACGDRTVRMHRTTSTREVRLFKEGSAFEHAALATSDGQLVIGGGQDGILHVWNGETGAPLHALGPPQAATAAKCVSSGASPAITAKP